MQTKKDNKNQEMNKTIVVRTMWARLPPEPAVVLEMGELTLPPTTLRALVATAHALDKRAYLVATGNVEVARGAMADACEIGSLALAHNGRREVAAQTDARPARMEVVSLLTSVFDVLGGMSQSRVKALAEKVAKLKAKVFGATLDPVRTPARDLWQRLLEVYKRLAENAELDKELRAYVPGELLEELAGAHEKLGETLGLGGGGEEPVVDLKPIVALVRRRIGHYVANVIAMAVPESPETVASALMALEPVTKLREDHSRRRTRRAAAKAGAETEEVDELDDDAETTTAADLAAEEETEAVATTPAAPPSGRPATAPVIGDT